VDWQCEGLKLRVSSLGFGAWKCQGSGVRVWNLGSRFPGKVELVELRMGALATECESECVSA